jgi:hypothetical protein
VCVPWRRTGPIAFWHRRVTRPSTILLAVLTGVFGAATIVLALLIGTGDTRTLFQVLRLGGLVTFGFAAGLVITVTNRRRREHLQRKSDASPGTFFVNAHPTDRTYDELDAWRPDLRVWFPCDLRRTIAQIEKTLGQRATA